MRQITKNDSLKLTNNEMRDAIRGMIKTSNRINYESGTSELNMKNLQYFLTGDSSGTYAGRVDHRFKIDNKGGIKPASALSKAKKEDLRKMYNDLAGYINSDIDSTLYEEKQKIARNKFIKFVNDDEMQNPEGLLITEEDAQMMFDLKDAMPELFDEQSVFYEEIVLKFAEYRQKNGQFPKSVLKIALEEKKKLIKKGDSYTMDDLKKNILNRIENTQNESYNPHKKKDRKSARLKRKAKRNKRR